MIIWSPCRSTRNYDALIKCLNEDVTLGDLRLADQELLRHHFHDRWVPLPAAYNTLKVNAWMHPAVWDLPSVKVLHYVMDKVRSLLPYI